MTTLTSVSTGRSYTTRDSMWKRCVLLMSERGLVLRPTPATWLGYVHPYLVRNKQSRHVEFGVTYLEDLAVWLGITEVLP